ncbi:MAG TPA: hypothetical protein VFD82_21835 [Planctomycetota bacterium]|nr:hypothetical protein [Planctomycetota bacterium]
MRLSLAFLLLLPACSVLPTAKERVQRVRDEVDLSAVHLVTWNGPDDVRRATAGQGEMLSYPFVRRVIKAQHLVLRRLGCLPAGDPDRALTDLAGDDPRWIDAFVVPPLATVVARPRAQNDVDLMCHELGHMASWYRGYWRTGASRVPLRLDAPADPAFCDLDALLAAWALEEGIAEATARAARSMASSGQLPDVEADRRIAQAVPSLTPPVVFVGPTNSWYQDLHVVLKAGETYVADESLAVRLVDLAYGTGLRHVRLHRSNEERLEATFARLWREFAGTTRQLLSSGAARLPSLLAGTFRAHAARLAPAPVGATRAGSFLVLQCLMQRHAGDFDEVLELATCLTDDLVLRWHDDGMLWITDWSDARRAEGFVRWVLPLLPGAELRQDGARVLVSWGQPATNALEVLAK